MIAVLLLKQRVDYVFKVCNDECVLIYEMVANVGAQPSDHPYAYSVFPVGVLRVCLVRALQHQHAGHLIPR
jgi:hypothetical protein